MFHLAAHTNLHVFVECGTGVTKGDQQTRFVVFASLMLSSITDSVRSQTSEQTLIEQHGTPRVFDF